MNLYSLVYFDDADDESMPEVFWPELQWERVKKSVAVWVKRAVARG